MFKQPLFVISSSIFCLALLVSGVSRASDKAPPPGCGPWNSIPGEVIGQATHARSPKLTGAKFPTVSMATVTLEKDKARGIYEYYLNEEQREARRFTFDQDGNTVLPDGRKLVMTKNNHSNQMNYVMDSAGNFYLFDEFTCPKIRHGSLLAGAPVSGAGNLEINDGRITYIDSDSGHYPSSSVFKYVHQNLKEHHADPNQK